MAYELYRVNKNNNFAQTALIENIVKLKWQDDITNVFISFEFETTEILECGDWIELFETDNSETVFYGLITKVTQTNVNTYIYNGYDYGYYLEKNNTVIQFTDATLFNAIKEICVRGKLRMGQVTNIEQKITKIYKNETLSKILFEIYKFAVDKGLKDRYYYDCTNDRVNLFEYTRNDNLQGFIANMYSISFKK